MLKMLEAGTYVLIVYKDNQELAQVQRTIDLQADAEAFRAAYPDLEAIPVGYFESIL